MIIETLIAEKGVLNKKYENLKKTNNKLLIVLAEYQRKMTKYEKASSSIKLTELPANVAKTLVEQDAWNVAEETSKYFTDTDTKELNSIGLLKRNDRFFVSSVLQILYRNDLSALRNCTMSVSVAKTSQNNNKIMSPEKKELAQYMMVQRANKVTDPIEKTERLTLQYINQIISKALFYEKSSN